MTTILITEKTIYADTQTSREGYVAIENTLKFIPMTKGRIALCCGGVSEVMAAIALLEDPGAHKAHLEKTFTSTLQLCVLNSDGFIETHRFTKRDPSGEPVPALWNGFSEWKSLGSGTRFINEIKRLMEVTPLEAMAHAARFDFATGEQVVSIPRTWNPKEGCPLTIHTKGRKRNKVVLLEHPTQARWALDVHCGQYPSPARLLETLGEEK